jgi:hypothetical protein
VPVKNTIKGFIVDLLGRENRVLSIDEIYRAFELAGHKGPKASIRGRLNSLAKEAKIARVSKANYASLQYVEFVASINPERMYSLLMTAQRGEWDNDNTKFSRSRFLEYTDNEIAEYFRPLNLTNIRTLLSLPVLFAYETGVEGFARVGRLRTVNVQDQTIDIRFDIDPLVPPISQTEFAQMYGRLDIERSEQHRTHWAIKNVALYPALSRAGLESVLPPPEPPSRPGPQFVPVDGRLAEVASLPIEDEILRQEGIHRLLRRDAANLVKSLAPAGNRYPELARVADEYAKFLDVDISAADVTAIWSVGGSLASFAQSYREQNVNRTLADPLEPHADALLQSVVRQHGAFIMGFREGRDLVQRSDEFTVDRARIAEIQTPGEDLLNELVENADLVEDRTRVLNNVIRVGVQQFGWTSSRVGYSAYLTIRNSFRAMIKFTVGENPNVGAILGLLVGASTLAGDPNAEFIRTAVPVLREHAAQLLAFFSHSPEMHAYVDWALRVLEDDRNQRES